MAVRLFKIFASLIVFTVNLNRPSMSESVPFLSDQPKTIDYSSPSMCPFDCNPKLCRQAFCASGVTSQLDGCGCCQICPRGQGDMCDYRNPCTEMLNCVYFDGTGKPGICRSNKTCRLASGKTLKDGEHFQPHCSMQCSCQGGLVGCASLCQNSPNSAFVGQGRCQRVRVPNSCCPQWVCDHTSSSLFSNIFFGEPRLKPVGMTTMKTTKQQTTTTKSTITTTATAEFRRQLENVDFHKIQVERPPIARIYTQPKFKSKQQPRAVALNPIEYTSISQATRRNIPVNCSGLPITLRSCSLNKCGLRLTDDFETSESCPPKLLPQFAYCLFKPCSKWRRLQVCEPDSPPLSQFTVRVRHSGCRTKKLSIRFCKSCRGTANSCCLPSNHELVAYHQRCHDRSLRTFYVAQATSCVCRSDITRRRDCFKFYQKMLDNSFSMSTQVFQQDRLRIFNYN